MKTKFNIFFFAGLLVCYFLLSSAVENENRKDRGSQRKPKRVDSTIKAGKNHTGRHDKRTKGLTVSKKVKEADRKRGGTAPSNDSGCTGLGGVCQHRRFICQGPYLKDKCSGTKTRQCCMPVGAWSVLCAGHHNNRIRACDVYGCGAFNSIRGDDLHKAVDVVCDDYGIINAPFSGSLAGPVQSSRPDGIQYDGVKILSDVHCVKIFNVRPYIYVGPVSQGEALGYLLPLQDRFSGITSHMELQMCDGSDPSSFI